MAIVQRSVNARNARTYTAPAMAPVGCGGDAFDERLDLRLRSVPSEVRRWNDDEDVDREEHAERRDRHAPGPADEISDERDRDDDRTGRDHRDGDGVEKLSIVEPPERLHQLSVQKRHDRQAASEHERARLREHPEDARERRRNGCCRCGQKEREDGGRERRLRCAGGTARHVATATVRTPARRNSHAISRSVHAVVRAIAPKMLHSRALRPASGV